MFSANGQAKYRSFFYGIGKLIMYLIAISIPNFC